MFIFIRKMICAFFALETNEKLSELNTFLPEEQSYPAHYRSY